VQGVRGLEGGVMCGASGLLVGGTLWGWAMGVNGGGMSGAPWAPVALAWVGACVQVQESSATGVGQAAQASYRQAGGWLGRL